jgi:hypothetical protein
MWVRLTRKYAEEIDGIDLSGHEAGDFISLSSDEARLIIAEGWGHPDRRIASAANEHRRRADDHVEPGGQSTPAPTYGQQPRTSGDAPLC